MDAKYSITIIPIRVIDYRFGVDFSLVISSKHSWRCLRVGLFIHFVFMCSENCVLTDRPAESGIAEYKKKSSLYSIYKKIYQLNNARIFFAIEDFATANAVKITCTPEVDAPSINLLFN